jgi:hypothetical protein
MSGYYTTLISKISSLKCSAITKTIVDQGILEIFVLGAVLRNIAQNQLVKRLPS